MMHKAILLLALAPLTACSSEPEVSATNASVDEVAEKMRKAGGSDAFVRAGKWQSTVRIESFEMPGAPPQVAEAMRSMHQRSEVATTCLTEADAKRPKEDFFAGAGRNCRYDHFNMADGKIDAMMNCSGGGLEQAMTMKGTYSPDAYQMEMAMKAQPDVGSGARTGTGMTMKMRVDAKRVGECDAKGA